MIPIKQDLTIYQGSSWEYDFYWYSDTEVVKAITAATLSYPTVLEAIGHGIPAGTKVPVSILDVGDWINTGLEKDSRIYAERVDDDNLSVLIDGTGEDTYTGSAGRLVYNTPMDLTVGWDARMQLRASLADDTVIIERLNTDGTITLGVDGLIKPEMSDAETDLLDFASCVYDLEMVNTLTSEVVRVAYGKAKLSKQVTRTP